MTNLVALAAGGARLCAPDDWVVDMRLADEVGAAAVVLGPADDAGFRPNAVVTHSQVEMLTLDEWEDTTDATLEAAVTGYLLLDRWTTGETTGDRLAAYVSPDGVDLTLRQRSLLHDGTGLTLSITVPTETIPETATLLDEMASTLAWEDPR